jgi:hypothetical protein
LRRRFRGTDRQNLDHHHHHHHRYHTAPTTACRG